MPLCSPAILGVQMYNHTAQEGNQSGQPMAIAKGERFMTSSFMRVLLVTTALTVAFPTIAMAEAAPNSGDATLEADIIVNAPPSR